MKVAVMQPYFFPYIGYWQLINAVDIFVIYDDVNYIKGGWINRNRILVNKQEYMLTLPLEKSSPNKLINEITLGRGLDKLIKTVSMAYRQAPNFDTAMPLFEEIFHNSTSNLAMFLESSIRKICDYIGIQTKILVSSSIDKDNSLRAQEKIIDICMRLKSDQYINSIGGQELYDAITFKEHGIKLEFVQPLPLAYKQFGNSFIPWLSIIDVLMFNSPQQAYEQLSQYDVVQP